MIMMIKTMFISMAKTQLEKTHRDIETIRVSNIRNTWIWNSPIFKKPENFNNFIEESRTKESKKERKKDRSKEGKKDLKGKQRYNDRDRQNRKISNSSLQKVNTATLKSLLTGTLRLARAQRKTLLSPKTKHANSWEPEQQRKEQSDTWTFNPFTARLYLDQPPSTTTTPRS